MLNPVRRNRNIGTAKQGHGRDNELRIPESWRDRRIFYEKLRSPVRVDRKVSGKGLTFLVEPTLEDCRHPCTIDDICRMLGYVPPNDLFPFDIVVLRQPTRKQRILSNAWGRLAFYYAAFRCSGMAIVLESQPREGELKWPKSLSPSQQAEIERLAKDGHEVRVGCKYVAVKTSLESCRNSQLYRTIPHEVGHYCHYRKVGDVRYDSTPTSEKEVAAHRYADSLRRDLMSRNRIPFERFFSRHGLGRDSLKCEWFS